MINEILWKTYTDVGCTAYTGGNLQLAQKMFEAAFREVENEEDCDSRLGASLRNLALVYHAQGQQKKAEPFFKRSLAICEKLLGPDHWHTANGLDNLADLYFTQGEHIKARTLYKRTIRTLEKLVGEDHPALVPRLTRLAWIHCALGNHGEAHTCYARVQEIKATYETPVEGADDTVVAAAADEKETDLEEAVCLIQSTFEPQPVQ